MSPALALAYYLWTRHRRSLIVVGAYWLAVIILWQVVRCGSLALDPLVSLSLWSFLAGSFTSLVLDFTCSREVWLFVRCESGFPARLSTLPLPTHALTGWLMLWGSATMILGWMALALAARLALECDVPLLWPGLLLAGFLAWVQAIFWTPFPLPWVRGYLLIPVMIVFGSTTIAVLGFGAPSFALCGLLSVLLLAAYGTAVRGVARARRGDNAQWGWPAWLRWPWAARTRRPFLSAAQAQLWFEWRLYGLVFPAMTAFYTVFMLLILLLFKNLDQLDREEQSFLQTWFSAFIVMLWVPATVWTCGMIMGSFGGGTYGPSAFRLSSFLATRPVSAAMLIRAKFVAAVWNTLAGWVVLAIGLLLWLVLSSYGPEAVQQFETMRQRYEPGLFWGWLVLLVVGPIVLIWLQMVQCMWIGLSGSKRMRMLSLFGFLALIELIVLAFFAYSAPIASRFLPHDYFEYWPVSVRLLPWLAGAAFLLKILAAAWSLHALRRRRLIPSGVLRAMLAIWLALAAALFAALYALLPDTWFSVPGVVLGIVLLLPLTRLALAPLALSWNRHR